MERNIVNLGTTHGDHQTHGAPSPDLTVAAVARLIAVAPATLRTWDRRYGLGPSVHQSGTHRRYGSQDVLRLQVMRLWIFRGSTSSQAASYARNVDLAGLDVTELHRELQEEIDRSVTTHEHPSKSSGTLTAGGPSLILNHERAQVPARVAPVKHLRLATETSGDVWRERCSALEAAALRSDSDGVVAALGLTESTDLIQWWKRLVRPAADRLASHTVLAPPGQSPNLVLFHAVMAELSRVTQDPSGVPSGHPSRLQNMVLVFSPGTDSLSLSAHILTGALVQNRVNGHNVTGPESPERIIDLVAMARPVAAVFIADQKPPNIEVLDRLVAQYPQLPIFIGLGGAGVLPKNLQVPQVSRIRSFTALFHEVVALANNPSFGSDYWDDPSRLVSLDHLK